MEKHEIEARALVLQLMIITRSTELSKHLATMQIDVLIQELNFCLSKVGISIALKEKIFFYHKVKEAILCI